MKFLFTQEEFESKQYKCLEFGDEKKIAERMSKNESLIQQMCSPNDERESYLYNGAKFIVSEMDVNFERGCSLFRLFISMVERHQPIDKPRCAQKETKKFNKELKDYYDADMCDEPLETQISELEDVERQTRELLKAKREELLKKLNPLDASFITNGNK